MTINSALAKVVVVVGGAIQSCLFVCLFVRGEATSRIAGWFRMKFSGMFDPVTDLGNIISISEWRFSLSFNERNLIL